MTIIIAGNKNAIIKNNINHKNPQLNITSITRGFAFGFLSLRDEDTQNVHPNLNAVGQHIAPNTIPNAKLGTINITKNNTNKHINHRGVLVPAPSSSIPSNCFPLHLEFGSL